MSKEKKHRQEANALSLLLKKRDLSQLKIHQKCHL